MFKQSLQWYTFYKRLAVYDRSIALNNFYHDFNELTFYISREIKCHRKKKTIKQLKHLFVPEDIDHINQMSIPSESKNLSTLITSDKAETWYRDFLESSLGTLKTKTNLERSKPTKSKTKKDESGSLRKMIVLLHWCILFR